MKTHSTKQLLAAALAGERREGRSVGFVPTMGALHEGHLSLLRRARADNDVVVASAFVNPLQFAPTDDFARYPRDLDADAALAAEAGVDHLFAPDVAEMYPRGSIATRVDVGPIGDVGEGVWRPGFFAGVATVCCKLLHIVGPDRAYFGQKDAQQLAVIRQLVADLDLPVEIVGCPTVREHDGLALSSRNAYLDPEARRAAPALAAALMAARDAAAGGEGSAAELRWIVEACLEAEPGIHLQYVDLFDPVTFSPQERLDGRGVLAAAAYVGGTRLIDNVEVVATVSAVQQRELAAEPATGAGAGIERGAAMNAGAGMKRGAA
ncbi:MAG TPA: pantoate--beta-alanine ligase [Actinomycetota bacterium]|nr:pantoate--beta-alanine ligase [Actinomycetota bacterium]